MKNDKAAQANLAWLVKVNIPAPGTIAVSIGPASGTPNLGRR